VMVTSVPWQLTSSSALDQRLRARAERNFSLRTRLPADQISDFPASGAGMTKAADRTSAGRPVVPVRPGRRGSDDE